MIPDLLAAPAAGAAAAILQAPAVADTVVAIQAYTGLDRWMHLAFSIATIVIALALIGIGIAVIAMLLVVRRQMGKVQAMMEKVRVDVDPILKHAVSVSDNVDYISTAVRGDVERLSDTVAQTTRRLNNAAAMAEERISDFNALLAVVQEEAESLFVSTAATVRGVQVGSAAFRRFRDAQGYDPYGGDPAELLDDDEGFEDEFDDDFDEDEDDDLPPRRRGADGRPRG